MRVPQAGRRPRNTLFGRDHRPHPRGGSRSWTVAALPWIDGSVTNALSCFVPPESLKIRL